MNPLEKAVAKTMSSVTKEVLSVPQNPDSRLDALTKSIGKVVSLKVTEIETEENVRKDFDPTSDEFSKLIESIKEFGLLQPIVVELRVTESNFRLICVAGHRRLNAVKALKTDRVLCLLQNYDTKSERTGAALTENLTREGLHFLDTADGYAELRNQGWTDEKISNQFERDIKTVRRFLTMGSWSEEAKDYIRKNRTAFPLRKIMHNFVQRPYSDEKSLMKALKVEVEGTLKQIPSSSEKQYKKLQQFYKNRPDITHEQRQMVEDALRYLKILQ